MPLARLFENECDELPLMAILAVLLALSVYSEIFFLLGSRMLEHHSAIGLDELIYYRRSDSRRSGSRDGEPR